MGGNVGVPLFKSLVLLHKVQVVPPHDDRPLHFGRFDAPTQNASSDRNESRERALAVNVVSLDGLPRGLEPQPDLLPVPLVGILLLLFVMAQILISSKHIVLFLEGLLGLI